MPAAGGLPAVPVPPFTRYAILDDCIVEAREYFANMRFERSCPQADDMDVDEAVGRKDPGSGAASPDVAGRCTVVARVACLVPLLR